MKNINHLLKKYEGYVPGEIRSREYDLKRKQRERIRERHRLADEIGASMFLRKTEMDTLHFLVDRFPNFRRLHGKAGNDTIITGLCFTLVRLRKPSARIYEYKVCGTYNLTMEVFTTIQTKIIGELLSSAPLIPVASERYDHELLCRNSRRQAEMTQLLQ